MKIYIDYPRERMELQLACLRTQILLQGLGVECFVPIVERQPKGGWHVIEVDSAGRVTQRQEEPLLRAVVALLEAQIEIWRLAHSNSPGPADSSKTPSKIG